MEYELLNLFTRRRSIRKFTDKKIDSELIEQILKAGLLAPSSKNKKPVEFIVIQDREIILELKKCKNKGAEGLNGAQCAILVIADSSLSDVWIEDASIATTFIQLAAEKLGLGSVWIQIRKRFNDNGDAEDEVRALLDIPENYGVLNIVALGYKDEKKGPHDIGKLDSAKIHYNRYKQP